MENQPMPLPARPAASRKRRLGTQQWGIAPARHHLSGISHPRQFLTGAISASDDSDDV